MAGWIRGRVDPWQGGSVARVDPWQGGSVARVDPRSVWIRGQGGSVARVDPWPGWIRGQGGSVAGWIRGRVDPWQGGSVAGWIRGQGGNRALLAWSVGLADFRPRDEKCRFPAGATKNQFPPRDYGLCIPAPAALFWTKTPAALFWTKTPAALF